MSSLHNLGISQEWIHGVSLSLRIAYRYNHQNPHVGLLKRSKMQRFQLVEGMLKSVDEVGGIPLMQPNHQCVICGNAVKPRFNTCSGCEFGDLDTEPLDEGYAVTMYLKQPERYKVQHIPSMKPVVRLSKLIRQSKGGKHHKQMAEILEVGLDISGSLGDWDLLTAPPSGSDGDNHMNSIGAIVSGNVGIPFDDSMYKKEDYPPQKEMATLQDRIDNVNGKIGWGDPKDDIDRAVVLDDIASSIATVANTTRALKENGVSQVAMLAISRNQDCMSLDDAGILNPE